MKTTPYLQSYSLDCFRNSQRLIIGKTTLHEQKDKHGIRVVSGITAFVQKLFGYAEDIQMQVPNQDKNPVTKTITINKKSRNKWIAKIAYAPIPLADRQHAAINRAIEETYQPQGSIFINHANKFDSSQLTVDLNSSESIKDLFKKEGALAEAEKQRPILAEAGKTHSDVTTQRIKNDISKLKNQQFNRLKTGLSADNISSILEGLKQRQSHAYIHKLLLEEISRAGQQYTQARQNYAKVIDEINKQDQKDADTRKEEETIKANKGAQRPHHHTPKTPIQLTHTSDSDDAFFDAEEEIIPIATPAPLATDSNDTNLEIASKFLDKIVNIAITTPTSQGATIPADLHQKIWKKMEDAPPAGMNMDVLTPLGTALIQNLCSQMDKELQDKLSIN